MFFASNLGRVHTTKSYSKTLKSILLSNSTRWHFHFITRNLKPLDISNSIQIPIENIAETRKTIWVMLLLILLSNFHCVRKCYIKSKLSSSYKHLTGQFNPKPSLGGDHMIPVCRDQISTCPAGTVFTQRFPGEIKSHPGNARYFCK